jgi:hypothetical protein
MNSYQVRFWDIRKISDTARGRYRVRWAVDGREHCKSFAARPLADAFLGTLKDAARDGKPFDPATGLPARPRRAAAPAATWYEHARAYAQMKWPDLAAKSRRAWNVRGRWFGHAGKSAAPTRPAICTLNGSGSSCAARRWWSSSLLMILAGDAASRPSRYAVVSRA